MLWTSLWHGQLSQSRSNRNAIRRPILFHLEQYCNLPIINQLLYTSDNKGLIIRMRQRQKYKNCYPNVTLAPDWNLTEAIHASNQHLTKPPKYKHVLGHQDKTTHYTQLPLTARLNVDADKAAGGFHWSHSTTSQTKVTLLPTTNAHLCIGDTAITGHYKHHILRAVSKAALFKQCQTIHNWETNTFNSIQLDSFQTALQNSVHRRKFIFKYVHNLLPTQAQKSIYGDYSPHCPS
jgi:hypothetical protein